jgi:hypothetical protein
MALGCDRPTARLINPPPLSAPIIHIRIELQASKVFTLKIEFLDWSIHGHKGDP